MAKEVAFWVAKGIFKAMYAASTSSVARVGKDGLPLKIFYHGANSLGHIRDKGDGTFRVVSEGAKYAAKWWWQK